MEELLKFENKMKNQLLCKSCGIMHTNIQLCQNSHEKTCDNLQQQNNNCVNIKRDCLCNYEHFQIDFKLLENSINIIQKEIPILKQQTQSQNRTTEEFFGPSLNFIIKSMSREIEALNLLFGNTKSKCCLLCFARGNIIQGERNFKNYNPYVLSCLICNHKNFCFNFSSSEVSCKLCDNNVRKKCDKHILNFPKFPCCTSCNQIQCKLDDKIQKNSDCEKLCCSESFSNLVCEFSNNINSINSSKSNYGSNKSILVGCSEGKVINFNPNNMKIIEDYTLEESQGNVINILLTEDKTITGIYNDIVIIWNDRTFKSLSFYIEYLYSQDIKHLKDGIFAIAVGISNKCLLTDITTNKIFCQHNLDVYPVTLCRANDSIMVIGCDDGIVRIWNTENNSLIYGLKTHLERSIKSIMKLNKSNEKFASSGDNGTIKLWELDTKSNNIIEICNKRISNAYVLDNSWSKMKELKDGRIVHCTTNYSVSIWDLRSLTSINMKSHSSYVYDFLELSDNLLLSCSYDKNIKKWDLRKHDTPLDELRYDKCLYRFASNE